MAEPLRLRHTGHRGRVSWRFLTQPGRYRSLAPGAWRGTPSAVAAREWRRLGIPLLAVVVLALGALWWWDAQHRKVEQVGPFRRGGVTLERLSFDRLPVSERGRVPELGGTRGDWVLSSQFASVVVGAAGPGVQRRESFGALLDAAPRGTAIDRLEEIRPILYLEGKRVPLETRAVEPDVTGQTPALIVTQRAAGVGVVVRTRITLDEKDAFLRLESVLDNDQREALRDVRLGDRVRWPGGAPFAPGLGFVEDERQGRARWLGRVVAGLAYGLVYPAGDVALTFSVDRVGPTEQLALADPVDVPAGRSTRLLRVLTMARGDLAAVSADATRLLGEPMGALHGVVEPAVPFARIEVRSPSGSPLLSTYADERGQFDFSLARGRYQLVLHAPGGRDVREIEVRHRERRELTLLAPRAGTLRVSVRDGGGAGMPARVTLTGRHPTPTPNLGAEEKASGIRNFAFTHDGEVNVELPPGGYTVKVTRGPEYSVFQKDVEISVEKGQSLQASLERVVDTKGWISTDLHVHAAPSFDSSVSLEDRVTALAAEGVEVAVATDHNHVTDYAPALEKRALGSELYGIVGVEITTVGWGHFNCYPYPKNERPPQFAGVVPWEIFQDARALAPRAVIQVNHPRMDGIGYFRRLHLPEHGEPHAEEGFSFDFDTLEVVNGFDLNEPQTIEKNLQDWFSLLDRGYVYTAVGNSDSHSLVFQWPGYPRTYVQVNDDRPLSVSADEIAAALIRGRAQISNGIFATVRVGRGEPGDLVVAEAGKVEIEVSVRAAPWVDVTRLELWQNGRLVEKPKLVGTSAARTVRGYRKTLDVEADAWLVVIVRGDRSLAETYPEAKGTPFAIVNPVFVDADGDGKFRAPKAPPPAAQEDAHAAGPHSHASKPPWERKSPRPSAENGGSAGSGP